MEEIEIGEYILRRHDIDSWWLCTQDGEGMQVKNEVLENLIDKFYQETF